jgi:tripartite-type tricarboxylate transporter receptor subunit TctC
MSFFARFAAVALLLFTQAVHAQVDAQSASAYPARSIRYVVPFGAGGPSDILARILAQRMTLEWGQPVIVENRTGAGGIIGADFVAKSVPDGYTLMMAQVGDAISMSLYSKLPYNFERDFAPVSLVGRIPFILVVHPSMPAKNVRELIALAKATPGTLTFASGGTGVASHLAGELFKRAAGIDVVHVPYKGQAPATNDLLGGQVSFMFSNPLSALPHLKAGKMRALAVSSPTRFSELPDVPTVAESGLAGFDVGFWLGAVAPAATPRAVVDKLNAETVRILRVPEVAERLGAMGLEIVGSTPDEFGRVIKSEVARWATVVREAGVKAD